MPAAAALRPAHQLEEQVPLVLHHRRAGRGPATARFQEATATFRPLTAAERDGFHEIQLRLVAAHEGETLAALVARAGGTGWGLPMIAVANDIDATAGLRRTQLVKVPRAEPYRPR